MGTKEDTIKDTITLKEFFLEKMKDSDKAVESARITMEKRLDSMNEFRGQLKDQAAQMLPRQEYVTEITRVDEAISELKKAKEVLLVRIDNFERAKLATDAQMDKRLESMNEFRGALKDQTALSFTRAEHVFYAEKVDQAITELRRAKDESAGKASITSLYFAYGFSIIGILMGLISIFLKK